VKITVLHVLIKITFVILQKSYTKKGKAKAAAAKQKALANGKTNGQITHDINQNEVKNEEKKGK
jgi:hypothetical protein